MCSDPVVIETSIGSEGLPSEVNVPVTPQNISSNLAIVFF